MFDANGKALEAAEGEVWQAKAVFMCVCLPMRLMRTAELWTLPLLQDCGRGCVLWQRLCFNAQISHDVIFLGLLKCAFRPINRVFIAPWVLINHFPTGKRYLRCHLRQNHSHHSALHSCSMVAPLKFKFNFKMQKFKFKQHS